ncbi:MAG: FecR family protein [Cyanobacteria bacterium J06629_9]
MLSFRRYRLPIMLSLCVGMIALSVSVSARTLSVRADRWLEFRSMTGSVEVISGGQTRLAQVGDRIRAIGDQVTTGRSSSARLAVDTQIGFVLLSENTTIRVSRLRATRSGGRVTELTVDRGQARLQVRSFTDPDSELNIRTPAGVNGVRGTDFGVAIQPNGRTGVATLEGEVAAIAAGETVAVAAGLQTMVVPNEPPDPPMPLTDNPFLDVARLEWSFVGDGATDDETDNLRLVSFQGRTDPVNLLIVNGETQPTERTGEFDLQIPVGNVRAFQVTVVTPLGTEQLYELAIP